MNNATPNKTKSQAVVLEHDASIAGPLCLSDVLAALGRIAAEILAGQEQVEAKAAA